MELTARDIHEKQFHDAWRGYNQEEVDDFLDKVAEALDLLQRENAAVVGRVRELEQALTTSRETEEMLKKTLVSAQQAAEEAIAKAQQKANALVSEAEERAQRTNEETRQRLAAVDAEIKRKSLEADREGTARRRELDASLDRLKAFESDLKRRLKAFLEQQTRSLEALGDGDQKPAPQNRLSASRSPTPREARAGRDEHDAAPAEGRSPSEESREDTPATGETLRIEDEPESAPRRGVRSLFLRDEG